MRSTDSVVVGLGSDVTIATLAALPCNRNLVTVQATVLILVASSITTLQLRIKRDGVEVDATDIWQMLASQVGGITMHGHWVDVAAGQNPVYTLIAKGTGTTPGVSVRERRLTASIRA